MLNFKLTTPVHHLIADKPVNQSMWRLMIRFNRMMPFLLRRKLVSKIWEDHIQMAGAGK
jgi:hypothetical protein